MWWAEKPGEFSAGGKIDSPTLDLRKMQCVGFALIMAMLMRDLIKRVCPTTAEKEDLFHLSTSVFTE